MNTGGLGSFADMSLFKMLLLSVTLLAAVGSGLMGGLFFAFSNFVMKALARLPAANGIAAMQSINVVVLNPLFLSLFVGTGLASAFLFVYALMHRTSEAAGWWIAGAVLYIVGNFIVTAACNVPRNEALDKVNPADASAPAVWVKYVDEWTRWNHVRTVTGLAAAACFAMALRALNGAVPE